MKNIALQLSLYAIVFLASCSTNTQKKTKETYHVVNPLITDTVYQNEYIAEINALQNVEIRGRIKGFIENIYVDEGQTVQKGQRLFKINSNEIQQDLLKAKAVLKRTKADLNAAKIELENTQILVDKNIVSSPELNLLKAKVAAMKANVEEAESDEEQTNLRLSFATIKAPFDGTINRIPYKIGSLVEEGTLLTAISNNKEVYAYFRVSETDYLSYITDKDKGNSDNVSLVLANGSLHNHPGVIETTESEFDKSTGNIAFRAKFPNPDQILKHGSSGKVLVKTALKDVMLIPQKLTFEVQENTYVFVVDKDNNVRQKKILPALRLPQMYVISSGLSVDDKLIYEGIQRVKDGDKIISELISFPQSVNPKN